MGKRWLNSFIDKYQQKKAPELPLIDVPFQSDLKIANLLKDLGLTKSTSESMRLLQQGAVKINGEKIDVQAWIAEQGIPYLIQVGKHRFMHIQLI